MDVALPVWTIRPNWKAGVLERLEWLTDVIQSETGVEQRRSVRQSPRRSFEITVNPTDGERTFLDLLMHRLGSEQWLFPLWHDQGALTEKAVVGAQALMLDTTFREYRIGDLALLYRDAFSWEVVEVLVVGDGALVLAGDVEKPWPRGTKVYPLRRATIQTETTVAALTSRVGQSVILFQLNEANDYPESTAGMTMYQGSPLIDREPNRSQEITLAHTRLFSEQDGEIGLRYRTDETGRAFAAQSHNWMVHGREEQARFRSLLYYLRGQQRMVWLPTFNDDLQVARPIAKAATRGDFNRVGFGYIGGPIPGRARFWTGKEVVLHTSLVAPLAESEERLTFGGQTANAYAPGGTWSFLEPARLNSDTIEITHHTDSDGVCEVATAFKTFANDRVAGMPIYLPTPEGVMNSVLCGEPPDAAKNPCYVPPSDLAMTVIYQPTQFYCNPAWDGNQGIIFPAPGYRPNGPGGVIFNAISFSRGGGFALRSVYENYVEGHPFLGGQLLYTVEAADFNNLIAKFYFPIQPGAYRYTVFPSARYCSSANTPKDPDGLGRQLVVVKRPGESDIIIGPQQVAGNGGANFDWIV